MKSGILPNDRVSSRGKIRLCFGALLVLLSAAAWAQAAPEQQTTGPLQGSYARGRDFFTGKSAFQNGGLACIACHSAGGLSFPNGGTLGPDLTQTYRKLGPAGTEAAMQTLYFPTMIPVYRDHQLTPQEQADMVAFFKQTSAGSQAETTRTTQILILAAFVLGIIFVALTAFFWRKRVLSVRRALVDRAMGRGARV
ncbi:MAG TPA: hypothetical protein VFJ52_08480 [Terriglobia bacterium]|nr:hypothetical protein [Terriglobia bacterium]